ncbi:MAG TPA: 1-acyl-sn-glycerol-3-phosphate acyltransferase [candidate division WOR-3 bacterium]|uniref:1-acyl-sn-glycerol-3-phosphate acyltransferase n=1 Tax=candidate division WOR-3 bacterium TaxID=2052148 RepID=A0A7C0VCX8_UNCW3|nr:1-acyl-sn-glycerol-3-phosphate acyltransferase [candidate division WOR-3 bacterium]
MTEALYIFGKVLIKHTFRNIFDMKWYGIENVPLKGPVIIAPNHRSNYDPPLVGSVIPRNDVFYFAKRGLFVNPVAAKFLLRVHAFPVDTEGIDVGAIKISLRILREGKALVLFPEGTRSKTGEFLPAKPGVGYLSLKTGAPVVPTLIWGTHEPMQLHFKRITPLYIKFSKPVYPPDIKANTDNALKFSEYILDIIKEMAPWK